MSLSLLHCHAARRAGDRSGRNSASAGKHHAHVFIASLDAGGELLRLRSSCGWAEVVTEGRPAAGTHLARIFCPACDGIYPADKSRRGCERPPWRVHCYLEPWPGIPVPKYGIRRAKVEQMADCCWGPLARGLTPHGLRHGHQTAMRRDRVPRVLRRDRLGHGRSSDIADHYTHIDAEMTGDLPARQTERWRAAINAGYGSTRSYE